MAFSNHSINHSAVLAGAAADVSVGMAVLNTATGFFPATAANRSTYSSKAYGVALTVGTAGRVFQVAHNGMIDASISGVGAGTAGDFVIVASNGTLTRTASPGGSDDIIGKCPSATGDVMVTPCALDGGGGGSAEGALGTIQTSDGSGALEATPTVVKGFAKYGAVDFGWVATGGATPDEWVTIGTDAAGLAANTFKTVYLQARALISAELTDGGFFTFYRSFGDPLLHLQDGAQLAIGADPATLGVIRTEPGGYWWARNENDDGDVQILGLSTAGDVIELGADTGADILIGTGLGQEITLQANLVDFDVTTVNLRSGFRIRDSGNTHWLTVALPGDLAADYTLAIPTITASDTIATLGTLATRDEDVWTPAGAPGTEVHSEAFELVHDGTPADQEVFRVEVPDAYATSHKVIVQCSGPNDQYFYREWKASWLRASTLVLEKDTPASSGDATGNEAGYAATLALDGDEAVLEATGIGTWSALLTRVRTENGTAPIVVSVTPSTGDTAGGESITVAGARFVTGAQVTIGGTACTAESVTNQHSMTATTPAKAGGTYDLVVTNPDTQTGTLVGGFTYAASFDPGTLSPVMWVRGDYAGPPWADESAGGTNDLVTGAADPPVGSALNGFDPADFVPTDFLVTSANNNTILGTSGKGGYFLVNSDVTPAEHGANEYTDGNLLTDAGNGETTFGLVTVGGTPTAVACIYDGAFKRVEATASADTNWQLIQWKHDNTDLKIRVNNGAWQSIACGAASYLVASAFRVGNGYSGTKQFDGRIMEIFIAQSAISDGNFDNIRAYINGRYGLAI